jgi:hypothetical protein
MNKPVWKSYDCDEASLISTLNRAEEDGYTPWKCFPIELEDRQDPVNLRKLTRVLARLKEEPLAIVKTIVAR